MIIVQGLTVHSTPRSTLPSWIRPSQERALLAWCSSCPLGAHPEPEPGAPGGALAQSEEGASPSCPICLSFSCPEASRKEEGSWHQGDAKELVSSTPSLGLCGLGPIRHLSQLPGWRIRGSNGDGRGYTRAPPSLCPLHPQALRGANPQKSAREHWEGPGQGAARCLDPGEGDLCPTLTPRQWEITLQGPLSSASLPPLAGCFAVVLGGPRETGAAAGARVRLHLPSCR